MSVLDQCYSATMQTEKQEGKDMSGSLSLEKILCPDILINEAVTLCLSFCIYGWMLSVNSVGFCSMRIKFPATNINQVDFKDFSKKL